MLYSEGLLAVRGKLKGGKMRYVPMLPELAGELRRLPAVIGEDRIFPPDLGATSGRQRENPRPRNIKMTERYAKLARQHIARTGSTAREIWKLIEENCDKANVG